MAESSTWTLTHITFDTETNEWRLKGERFRPPIDENERFYAIAPTFAEAIADWEEEARRHARLDAEPMVIDTHGRRPVRVSPSRSGPRPSRTKLRRSSDS